MDETEAQDPLDGSFEEVSNDIMSDIESTSNRKAMNRNWSYQKAIPLFKPKREINKYYK